MSPQFSFRLQIMLTKTKVLCDGLLLSLTDAAAAVCFIEQKDGTDPRVLIQQVSWLQLLYVILSRAEGTN